MADNSRSSRAVLVGFAALSLVGTLPWAWGLKALGLVESFPRTLIALVLMASVGAGVILLGLARREEDGLAESGRRLTRAEQSLEEVLRAHRGGAAPPVHGRAIPAQDVVVSEEGEEPFPSSAAVTEDPVGLALPELWATTHARLDHYHKIATGQAEKSFRNAQIASGLGFVLLVIFVMVALKASTTAGSIVVGGLGAVSAALAGYVSRTFVRSQEASAGHLRSYFDQPLELSRFLAAERLVAEVHLSDTQRAEVVAALVQSMVTGPQPSVGRDAGAGQ
ncbi:hypothetical protein AB0939_06945 [Streptomyces sp. NPDC006990]|uniref:hypothetical protein n=1 Tax=Streptomyces sp. NPDC006990 TaxID=3154481 RepID=UPI0034529D72